MDPQSGKVIRLFHPRQNVWTEHFAWDGPKLVGLTPVGRATIAVLCINRSDALLVRAALMQEGILVTPHRRRR